MYRVPGPRPPDPHDLIAEIHALDAWLGAWAASVPAGTPAPPEVVRVSERRDAALAALRELAKR